MAQVLETGDENAGQTLALPVPGRSTPIVVRPVPSSSVGAPQRNLSNVVFADNGASAPATPTGNIEAPFTTFADGLTALIPTTGGSLWLTPNDYTAEGPLVVTNTTLSIVGMGSDAGFGAVAVPILPSLDLSPPPFTHEFFFVNVQVQIDGANNVANIWGRNSIVIGNNGNIAARYMISGGSFSGLVGGGGISCFGAFVAAVDVAAGASNVFRNCAFTSSVALVAHGGSGTYDFDVQTLASFKASASTITGAGFLVSDGPQLSLAWGAASANSNDWLNPSSGKAAAALAASINAWNLNPGTARYAHSITARLRAAHTQPVTCTVAFAVGNPAFVTVTALTVTIPTGQLVATFDLLTDVVLIPANAAVMVQLTSAAAVAANSIECDVGLS